MPQHAADDGSMIRTMTFRARQIFSGRCPKDLERIRNIVERKMEMLDVVTTVNELRYPPGNRLKALSGNLLGFHAIRINDQFRLIFRWEDGDAFDVDIVDYH